jgi:hypothetical protein
VSLLDRLRGSAVASMSDSPQVDSLSEALRAEQETNLLLTESIAELEQDNRGWLRLDGYARQLQFTRQGLIEIAASARLNWLANPLIQRAVNVRMFYTWGQGVEVSARDEDVNVLVQAFMDDPMNQQVLFGHDARQDKDRALQLDGNLFFALFTQPLTGRVQVRSIPWSEVTQVISNPQDREERWFYKREWTATTIDPATGSISTKLQTAFYPALGYRPQTRMKQLGPAEVMWDSPVLHLKAGGLDGMDFGVSEVFSALSWARAYKGFLEDWASLAKALSKFAWKGKAKLGRVSAMRAAVEAPTVSGGLPPRNVPGAGQAMISDGTADLTPISKTGATLDADSGRPLAMMVAAAMDIPYTILMGDADMGNLATAKTLDRPTELAMQSRREMYSGFYRQLCDYVVDQAVKAPRGVLRGTVGRDEYGREVITLAGDADRSVDIEWPSILEHDVKELVDAIVAADGTGRVPPEMICRWLLLALGAENVDEIMADLTADDGTFLDPGLAAQVTAGAEAVRQFRAGQDPAAAVA